MMHFRSNAVDCCEAQPAAKRSNTGRRSDHAPNFEGMSNERLNALLLKPHNSLPGRGAKPLPIPNLVGGPVVQLELARSEQDIRDILMVGNTTKPVDVEVGLPKKPKRVLINAMHDVLTR